MSVVADVGSRLTTHKNQMGSLQYMVRRGSGCKILHHQVQVEVARCSHVVNLVCRYLHVLEFACCICWLCQSKLKLSQLSLVDQLVKHLPSTQNGVREPTQGYSDLDRFSLCILSGTTNPIDNEQTL